MGVHVIKRRRGPKLLGTVAVQLVLAAGLWAAEQAPAASSSLEMVDALHARIAAAVAEGRLPAETGAAADELVFTLRTEQIRSDAEIEILKLEAARFTGEEQQEALARLVRAGAAGERRRCQAIRQLEAMVAAPAADEASRQEAEAKEKGRMRITFEPADLIDDPDG